MVFPLTPNLVTIELYYSGAWNDISQYVYHRSMEPIVITRGRANEGQRCDPGQMTLELNNRSGRFSPRNPNSPLFGLIGRNTPIRVKVTYGATTYVRIVAEVSSWPSRWDVTGRDVWVPIEAHGILKRLGQGSKPLRSPMFRAISGIAAGDYVPAAYWPMEDEANATQFASGLASGSPASVSGDVTFAIDGELEGSYPLPQIAAGSVISAAVPAYTDTDLWVVQLAVKIDSEPGANTTILEVDTPGGSSVRWKLFIEPGSPTNVWWAGYDSAGVITGSSTSVTLDSAIPGNPSEADFYGHWFFYTLSSWADSPGSVAATISITDDGGIAPSAIGFGGPTHAAATLLRLYGHSGVAVGHWAVFTDPAFNVLTDAFLNSAGMHGYNGESAEDRFDRLCRQAGLPFEIVGSAPALMGPERTLKLLDALLDPAGVDQGFMFETRDSLGLQLRTNSSRYSQIPITLSYTGGNISPPFDPEPDDFAVMNDVEVKRYGGSSSRQELTVGALSTQDPPDGVGRYDDTITVDAFDDDQLDHIAAWRLHVGTWDAERYPRVKVDLAVPGNSSIVAAIAAADSGDLLTIANLPAWLPPETAELLIEGYKEAIGFFTWDFVFNTSPAGPYNVVGAWGLMAQELQAAINSSVTTADIATTAGPLLATSIGSGYTAKIGGEEIQVTAVAASTVTFGTTGTVAHANNASVTPGIPASVATGDLLLCLAAIRSSGTGVPSTPAGYTRLPVFNATDNVQLFAKIATSGAEAAPTVSFTGGAAGDDTSAQMIRLAGKWHSASFALLASAARLNAAGQNITYPGLPLPTADNCIILYLGWKQDDWTSVATIAGATEIGEPSTTTGNDQGMVWDYVIQTTAAAIASGVFTVTGGTSQISRGAVLALRCDYQTATITRSVNGVSASHSAADAVTLARPARWAL